MREKAVVRCGDGHRYRIDRTRLLPRDKGAPMGRCPLYVEEVLGELPLCCGMPIEWIVNVL